MLTLKCRHMLKLLVLCCVPLLASGLAQEAPWYPKEFFVEVTIDQAEGETATIGYFIGADRIRGEYEVEGETSIIIITKDDSGVTTRLLDPVERTYLELPGDMTDLLATVLPLDSSVHPCSSEWQCEKVGAETVNGRPVEVWAVRMPEFGASTVWLDEELRFPLRTVGTTLEGVEVTLEVTRLEVGPQPEELFTVPEGYEKVGF